MKEKVFLKKDLEKCLSFIQFFKIENGLKKRPKNLENYYFKI